MLRNKIFDGLTHPWWMLGLRSYGLLIISYSNKSHFHYFCPLLTTLVSASLTLMFHSPAKFAKHLTKSYIWYFFLPFLYHFQLAFRGWFFLECSIQKVIWLSLILTIKDGSYGIVVLRVQGEQMGKTTGNLFRGNIRELWQ